MEPPSTLPRPDSVWPVFPKRYRSAESDSSSSTADDVRTGHVMGDGTANRPGEAANAFARPFQSIPFQPRPDGRETPIKSPVLYAISMDELRNFKHVAPEPQVVVDYVRDTLAPLEFDRVLSLRVMTHPLGAIGDDNHNGRMASFGAGVLRAHMTVFLSLHRSLLPLDVEYGSFWLSQLLSQERLGRGPGTALGVEKAMRYRETLEVIGDFPRWTHRGQIVEALTGLVHKNYGGLASLRFFSSRVLPHLQYPPELKEIVAETAAEDHDLGGQGSSIFDAVQARQRRVLDETQ